EERRDLVIVDRNDRGAGRDTAANAVDGGVRDDDLTLDHTCAKGDAGAAAGFAGARLALDALARRNDGQVALAELTQEPVQNRVGLRVVLRVDELGGVLLAKRRPVETGECRVVVLREERAPDSLERLGPLALRDGLECGEVEARPVAASLGRVVGV